MHSVAFSRKGSLNQKNSNNQQTNKWNNRRPVGGLLCLKFHVEMSDVTVLRRLEGLEANTRTLENSSASWFSSTTNS